MILLEMIRRRKRDGSPSGHATQAFALATVVAEHYESPWVTATSYGLASLVGLARMNNDAHWASDVVAGAAIGCFVGDVVVKTNGRHRRGHDVSLVPLFGPDMRGVMLSFQF